MSKLTVYIPPFIKQSLYMKIKQFNFFSFLLILCCFFAYVLDAKAASAGLLLLAIIQIGFFCFVGIKEEKGVFTLWASPLYMVILGLFIVNYQAFINVELGFGTIDDYHRFKGFDHHYFPILLIAISAMTFFLIGALNYRKVPQNNSKSTYSLNTKITNILLALSFAIFLLTINVGEFMSGSVYANSGAAGQGVADYGYSERFLDSMIYISIAVYSYRLKEKYGKLTFRQWLNGIPLIFWGCVGCYLVLRLFSGDRGPIIEIGSALFFSCVYCTKLRLKLGVVITILILSAFFMTVISYARLVTGEVSTEEKIRKGNEAIEAIETKNISPLTQELASSDIIIYIIRDEMEQGKLSYQYGINAITVLVMCIPGMGLFLKTAFGNIPFQTVSSSQYATVSMLGEDYSFGLGSSVLADFYYDFGVIGCCVGFLILGIIVKKVTYNILYLKKASLLNLIVTLKIASLSIYIARSTLWLTLGAPLFIIVIYYAIMVLTGKYGK